MLQIFGGLVLGCINTKFASKYAFDSIFQALQHLHTFESLRAQNFSKKNLFEKSAIFVKIQQKICKKFNVAIFAKFSKFQKIQLDPGAPQVDETTLGAVWISRALAQLLVRQGVHEPPRFFPPPSPRAH